MKWVNDDYSHNLRIYEKRDARKAIIVYCLILGSAFFQGWLYTTNLNVYVLNLSQIGIPLLITILFLYFFHNSRENISSIGIHAKNLKKSIISGIAGGVLLLAIQILLYIIQGKSISFTINQLFLNWVIYIVAGFEEEILFRGYIQTRMSGLINSQLVISIINSLLFLLINYPVRWVVSGMITIHVLSFTYIICLIVLHFFCDAVYKRTNCLWGSVVLHIIYNAVGAMIIIQ